MSHITLGSGRSSTTQRRGSSSENVWLEISGGRVLTNALKGRSHSTALPPKAGLQGKQWLGTLSDPELALQGRGSPY